jgi:acyl carrier protein
MLKKVTTILCSVIDENPDTITEEQNLIDDLGLSSLDVINIVVMFEEEFDIEIPDRHILNFVTVGDVVRYINERINS